MLPGGVPFPPEFAARYRARGYWRDRPLRDEFADVWRKFADRVALIDGNRRYTYVDIDRITDNLALNLLELGLKPTDRVVPTLPNVAEFVLLYFALQKIGAIPIAALVTHRYSEINQFVNIAQATACIYPERIGDFAFGPVIKRIADENPC
ncbi:MAG: AMP-binding protein, partial [Stellaceae bacterium]